MDPFIGEIRPVPYNFAPQGWALCEGQIMAIQQNTALFSLLGTNYGGNGTTTFGLPDLRGRVAIAAGQGPGLQPYSLGEMDGVESVTLTVLEMPSHDHPVNVFVGKPASNSPQGNRPSTSEIPVYGMASPVPMANDMVQPAGGNQPHPNIQPYTAINYIIALQGIFPSRN